MNNMAVCNYIVGVLGAVIGGLIMQAAAAFPLEFTENGPGPGFWPFALGAVLGAVSVLLLLYTFINKTDLHGVKVQLSSTGNKALMIAAVMRLMDYRNYKVIGLTTVLCLLFIYLVFGMLLHTQMPQSVFME